MGRDGMWWDMERNIVKIVHSPILSSVFQFAAEIYEIVNKIIFELVSDMGCLSLRCLFYHRTARRVAELNVEAREFIPTSQAYIHPATNSKEPG